MNSNAQVKNDHEGKSNDTHIGVLPMWLKVSLVFVSGIAIGILFLYFGKFNGPLGTQETFAQFGDFLGGTLNPILGFATIGLLIWSINIQMKELRLTREELAATKNEAEKSRLALEGQVTHLEREAKLSEITRLLNIQFIKYDTLLKSRVLNEHNLCYEIDFEISDVDVITCENVLEGKVYGHILDFVNWDILRSYIQKVHCSGTRDGDQWVKIELVAISISKLIKKYLEIQPSVEFEFVYLPEARSQLRKLYECLGSGDLIDANTNLDLNFNPNQFTKYANTRSNVV